MKYIFLGMYFFGWFHSLGQVEVTEFPTMDDCDQHMRQVYNMLKFERDNNGAWVDWKMTCGPKLLLDEQGRIIPGQKYD